jgi:hypothetical protein
MKRQSYLRDASVVLPPLIGGNRRGSSTGLSLESHAVPDGDRQRTLSSRKVSGSFLLCFLPMCRRHA